MIVNLLSGAVLPIFLLAAGAYFTARLAPCWLAHPKRMLRGMLRAEGSGGTLQWRWQARLGWGTLPV